MSCKCGKCKLARRVDRVLESLDNNKAAALIEDLFREVINIEAKDDCYKWDRNSRVTLVLPDRVDLLRMVLQVAKDQTTRV